MPFKIEINKLNTQFEDIKHKVSNEGMLPLFAQFEVEDMLKIAKQHYSLWKNLPGVEEDIIEEIRTLVNEMKQYLDDLFDMIEIARNM